MTPLTPFDLSQHLATLNSDLGAGLVGSSNSKTVQENLEVLLTAVAGLSARLGVLEGGSMTPTLSLSSAVTQAEGDTGTTAFSWTLTLNRDGSTASFPFAWAVTGSGLNPADAVDFGGTLPSGSGTFATGETSKTITVNVSGDTTIESDETFLLTVTATGLNTVTSTGTISSDDAETAPVAVYATLASGWSTVRSIPGAPYPTPWGKAKVGSGAVQTFATTAERQALEAAGAVLISVFDQFTNVDIPCSTVLDTLVPIAPGSALGGRKSANDGIRSLLLPLEARTKLQSMAGQTISFVQANTGGTATTFYKESISTSATTIRRGITATATAGYLNALSRTLDADASVSFEGANVGDYLIGTLVWDFANGRDFYVQQGGVNNRRDTSTRATTGNTDATIPQVASWSGTTGSVQLEGLIWAKALTQAEAIAVDVDQRSVYGAVMGVARRAAEMSGSDWQQRGQMEGEFVILTGTNSYGRQFISQFTKTGFLVNERALPMPVLYKGDEHNSPSHRKLKSGKRIVFGTGHGFRVTSNDDGLGNTNNLNQAEDATLYYALLPNGLPSSLPATMQTIPTAVNNLLHTNYAMAHVNMTTGRFSWATNDDSTNSWIIFQTDDEGGTWTRCRPFVKLDPTEVSGGDAQIYCRMQQISDDIFRVVEGAHPTNLNNVLHIFDINTTTGDIVSGAGTIGNMIGAGAEVALSTGYSTLRAPASGNSQRLLDIGPAGDRVLVAEFNGTTGASPNYWVGILTTPATPYAAASWTWTNTGTANGYLDTSRRYVQGGGFARYPTPGSIVIYVNYTDTGTSLARAVKRTSTDNGANWVESAPLRIAPTTATKEIRIVPIDGATAEQGSIAHGEGAYSDYRSFRAGMRLAV